MIMIYCQFPPCGNSRSHFPLYNAFHDVASQNSIIHYIFHHAATEDPSHGTKFVTLPSSYLTLKVYDRPGSVYYLLGVVSTSSVVCSQVRRFFLMRIVFCTINHDE